MQVVVVSGNYPTLELISSEQLHTWTQQSIYVSIFFPCNLTILRYNQVVICITSPLFLLLTDIKSLGYNIVYPLNYC